MSKAQKVLGMLEGKVQYRVYYMDNDGHKRVVEKGLSYQQAVKFCQKNRKGYGTDLNYELQEARKINQRGYKFWVVYKDKIVSGWEYKEGAQDHVKEIKDEQELSTKVYQRVGLKKLGLDPDNNDSWGNLRGE